MTASSVDFFPCRVRIMGLPPLPTSLAAARPSIAKIRGISRNLFGAPDPSEMKTLYKLEEEGIRSYVLQRYNFDTNSLKPTNEQECKNPTDKIHINHTAMIPEMQPTQLPVLIEKEFRRHELCLHDEKQCLNTSPLVSVQTEVNISKYGKGSSKKNCRCESSSLLPPAVECQKPYSRQSLLKESFNIRKNPVHIKKSGQHCNPETITLKNSQNYHRNLEILHLTQPLNIQRSTCDIQDNGNQMPTCKNFISQRPADIEENRSKTISCNDNCTILSVQLVVSTQNES